MLSDSLCVPSLVYPVPSVHISYLIRLFMVMTSCRIAHHCLYVCIFVVMSLLKDWLEFHRGCHGPLLRTDIDRLSSTVPGPPVLRIFLSWSKMPQAPHWHHRGGLWKSWGPGLLFMQVFRPRVYQQALLTSAARFSPWGLCETETFAASWWCN